MNPEALDLRIPLNHDFRSVMARGTGLDAGLIYLGHYNNISSSGNFI